MPTAISGLDELIEGGFIENDVILLTGGPGAGKSTFGIKFLYEGIVAYPSETVIGKEANVFDKSFF